MIALQILILLARLHQFGPCPQLRLGVSCVWYHMEFSLRPPLEREERDKERERFGSFKYATYTLIIPNETPHIQSVL